MAGLIEVLALKGTARDQWMLVRYQNQQNTLLLVIAGCSVFSSDNVKHGIGSLHWHILQYVNQGSLSWYLMDFTFCSHTPRFEPRCFWTWSRYTKPLSQGSLLPNMLSHWAKPAYTQTRNTDLPSATPHCEPTVPLWQLIISWGISVYDHNEDCACNIFIPGSPQQCSITPS